jgi:hypothetical protein
MSTKSGWQKLLSRNTGSFDTPTWNAIPNVMDVDVEDSFDEEDVTDRGDGGVKTTEPNLRVWGLKFKMLEDFANEDFTALITAYRSRAVIEVCVHDGAMATVGTQYTRAVCKVMAKPVKEPIGGRVAVDFTLKPAKNGGVAPVADGSVSA